MPLEAHHEEQPYVWRGTFGQYLTMVERQPALAAAAHQRIWQMIEGSGYHAKRKTYNMLSDEIFGIDHVLDIFINDYLRPAALGFDVKKRILLLVGPVSSGKSSLVSLLKRSFESYSHTDAGALYGIAGCPMHEEPLHLLPPGLRQRWSDNFNIHVEGELCPWCRWRLEHEWANQLDRVPIERIFISEKKRVGIGTYAPSDPKSQDIADLTGSLDFHAITEYGVESDPRAFRFDGELNIANRGIMEFQEMLKLDEKFLYHLLSLSQEGNFKTGRYELISADEMIIGHTNEAEYQAFVKNPRNEALLSRLFVLPVPYNLNVDDEIAIYQKLLQPHMREDLHFAPHALECAATATILSRLKEGTKPGSDRLSKLVIYRSDDAKKYDMMQDGLYAGEGMQGLDPRYTINRLASLASHPAKTCINGMDVLHSLRDGMQFNPFVDTGLRESVAQWIEEAKVLYDRTLEEEVFKALRQDWGERLEALFQNYLDSVVAVCTGGGGDIPLLRNIEERLNISALQAPAFREEIYMRMKLANEKTRQPNFLLHVGLKKALEEKLFDDLKDSIKITTKTPVPDTKTLARIEQAVGRMVETGNWCPECAARAISHVGGLLNR